MLNVPTLWTAFVVNFLALGLIWAYILYSYPSFVAARHWTAAAFTMAAGSLIATLTAVTGSLVPLLFGGTIVVFSTCLAVTGVWRFYGEPVSWLPTVLVVGLTVAAMAYFMVVRDDMPVRIAIFSLGQAITPWGAGMAAMIRSGPFSASR